MEKRVSLSGKWEKVLPHFIFASLALVLVLTLHVFYKLNTLFHPLYSPRISFTPFPPLSEIRQNIGLLFQFYPYGYLRSILGTLIFAMMASFFISMGKIALRWILPEEHLSSMERFSLWYILGSLMASLIWLGLGMMGHLNWTFALLMGLFGCTLLSIQTFSYYRKNPYGLKTILTVSANRFTVTEKILIPVLFVLLLRVSSTAYIPPHSSDTLVTHITLPNYYINQGKVVVNPYHFLSYTPQNTEMLVLWALLLKSEFAAALLMPGFLTVFILLLWGFTRRTTDHFISVLTLFVFLSVPVIGYSSVYIKNDLPAAMFIFAHYCALIEAFNLRVSCVSGMAPKRQMLLSGLLCGGAIGHKLILLPVAFFSSLFIFLSDLNALRKNNSQGWLLPYWLMGVGIPILPWILRTALITGNPFYPFFSRFFPWAAPDPYLNLNKSAFNFNSDGLPGVLRYFHRILLLENGLVPDGWGPSLAFGVLALFSLFGPFAPGYRLCAGSCILSLLTMFRWLDLRYHIGLVTFIVCIPFACSFHEFLKCNPARSFKVVAFSIIFLCFSLSVVYTHGKVELIPVQVMRLISGNSPGNYPAISPDDVNPVNTKWMTHLLNTRTREDETVLYIGINYAYGLERKMIFSSGFDRHPIMEFSKNSINSDDLRNHLLKLGIHHVLIDPSFFDKFRESAELKKIKELLEKYMELRITTPDHSIAWYSFKSDMPQPVVLDSNDAAEYPLMFMAEALRQLKGGHNTTAQRMMEIAVHSPMSHENRFKAYLLLLSIYKSMDEDQKYEEAISFAAKAL